MDKFRIVGPQRLDGRIQASGAKNAALPALCASLLCDGTLTLRGLPRVRDILTMTRLLGHLGVEAVDLDGHTWSLTPRDAPADGEAELDAPYELVKTMRASILVLGPLVARHGIARVSLPGGCAIGVRPIDLHLKALEAMGAEVRLEHGYVEVRANRLEGVRHRFAQPTVTGTENLMMAATLARGTTVLENCAREPEVADLAELLSSMGARIEGASTDVLEIEGVDRLGSAEHRVVADRIEVGTYLLAAVASRGKVFVDDARAEHLEPLLEKLHELGSSVDVGREGIGISHQGEIRARDMVTAPHPGFPTDLQAQYLAVMTQASGSSTVCETVFENRFQHVPELARMGARIEIDGSYARVQGPASLSGASVMATDLRASASLVIASLVASGESVIDRIYHLDRGYETMESKLQQLGVGIERIST